MAHGSICPPFLRIPLMSLLALALLFAPKCKSTITKTEQGKHQSLSTEEFTRLNWQDQVEYLEYLKGVGLKDDDDAIVQTALTDDDSAVVISALQLVDALELKKYVISAKTLLASKDPIIRWRALLAIEKLYRDDDILPQLARLTNDPEWMVREATYRTLRLFKAEQERKTYFYTVLFKLSETNPQVIVEIYRTLVWYGDESAWSYMMKRSYHCKTASELVLVMRELARTKTRDAQVRIKTLTRSQSALIREEAKSLLGEYF